MSDYADWQGIDRGHEWYWHRPTWIGVLTALNECGGSADFSNKNSMIYAKFKELTPQFPGFSIKNGEWRSDFRDGREPWVGTDVISFDDSQMKLTENGKLLLSGQKKYNEIFFETIRNYSENGENPFAVLADVFLSLPIYQGLSIDDAVKVMRHYRPSENDDLKSTLLGNVEEISTTNKRRLRHILRLLTFAGGLYLDSDDIYYISSREILKSLCKNNYLSPEQIKNQFILWLKDNCKGTESFKDDMVKIIECWLDQKMPNDHIGNLFRFSKASEYEQEKARITNLPQFETVNRTNQNGRPRTALNHYTNFLIHLSSLEDNPKTTESDSSKSPSPFTPTQIIYYGVPGCGKSHTITTMLKDEKVKDPTFSEENQVVRTTFHPEYTSADFIGQILPEVHEDSQGKSVVEYKFKPGPFAKILKQALHNPSRPFYLVIEEINRGNAAAIFGDVFQLLDRLKNGDTSKEPVGTDGFENHYGKGWSEYFVMNADVNAYIRDANSDDELDTKSIDVSGIHFSSSTGLRLPPNLSIYATMNTSDQNVFTLDNAFQRRWDMELVSNTCKWNDEDHKKQAQSKVGDTEICWETFRKAINSEISDGDFFNADDKQLGLFFIEAEGDKIDGKMFANKVLKYLWADVFKRDTGKIFKSENLSKVVEDFTGTDAFDKVFADEFVQSLKSTNDEIKNHE